ncbi:MAG TPA: ATP-dependent helicase C-terminal domain-containing protein, partial [Longimicrobiales bacterium]|nr:ATP-dependent helicase C-terminal domain-containing protein [Longimicrobiales bacterium]
TGPGVCYRLWTKQEDRGLVPRRRPEILEADLAPLALTLAAWGAEPGELRWLDPPPGAAYAQARELLAGLEALDAGGAITDHGRRMADLGTHPRLAHMLLRGEERGLGALACDLAALLGERDVLRARGRAPDADLRLRVEALIEARAGGRARVGTVRGQSVHRGRLGRALREARHWRRALGIPGEEPVDRSAVQDVGVLAAWAYPDRIGRGRGRGEGRFLLRNGRGARFAEPQPLADADWLVAAELEGRGREARIFQAAPLTREEIEAHFGRGAREMEEVVWDGESGRVRARRRRMLGALVLEEAPLAEPDPAAVVAALLEGIREEGLQVLPWSTETRQLRRRLAFLHGLDRERWPDASRRALEAELDGWLGPFLRGFRSLDDLGRLDLAEALLSGLSWDERRDLDNLAPTHLEVPSGSKIRLDYSDPEAPALAVRLQEVFGLTETPRIAGGRVPVTMKLLSPARRPVQVTRDLESFWRDAYFEVRKDLRGRYPKHDWPENPLEAQPTRRTRPRGGG